MAPAPLAPWPRDSCIGGENDISAGLQLDRRARIDVPRLIYIGGYGRSGSTLLEYLLAASPQVDACGEVASVLRDRGRKKTCT
jgi:hypothetical protein